MTSLPVKATSGPEGLSDPFLNPFSIKKSFGRTWKIQVDESWACETAENRRGCEGWYEQILCRCGGFIALHQHHPTVILMFFTSKQRITCRRLAEQFKDIPGVRLDTHFDGHESVFYFPVKLFDQVAAAVGARRKRQGRPLTDAQKIAFAEGRKKGMAALKRGRDSLLSGPP